MSRFRHKAVLLVRTIQRSRDAIDEYFKIGLATLVRQTLSIVCGGQYAASSLFFPAGMNGTIKA